MALTQPGYSPRCSYSRNSYGALRGSLTSHGHCFNPPIGLRLWTSSQDGHDCHDTRWRLSKGAPARPPGFPTRCSGHLSYPDTPVLGIPTTRASEWRRKFEEKVDVPRRRRRFFNLESEVFGNRPKYVRHVRPQFPVAKRPAGFRTPDEMVLAVVLRWVLALCVMHRVKK